MSGASKTIVTSETTRLSGLGISPICVREADGCPVAVVSASVLIHIIESAVPGRYVSFDGSRWTGLFVDDDGSMRCISDLSEQKAYRVALGHPIGRRKQPHRYALKCGDSPRRKH